MNINHNWSQAITWYAVLWFAYIHIKLFNGIVPLYWIHIYDLCIYFIMRQKLIEIFRKTDHNKLVGIALFCLCLFVSFCYTKQQYLVYFRSLIKINSDNSSAAK